MACPADRVTGNQPGYVGSERIGRKPHARPNAADRAPEIAVSRETSRRLADFVQLLRRWNEHVNLVSAAELSTIWDRHIADSLQLLPFLRIQEPPFIDLGSGAGFPGLVLAIAADRRFHLIESDRRKAAFLCEAARVTAAPVSIHATRIQSATLGPASVVTARGLAPLPELLALAHPLLRADGVLLALKGKKARLELTAAQSRWHMRVAVIPSCTDSSASILRISDLRRAR